MLWEECARKVIADNTCLRTGELKINQWKREARGKTYQFTRLRACQPWWVNSFIGQCLLHAQLWWVPSSTSTGTKCSYAPVWATSSNLSFLQCLSIHVVHAGFAFQPRTHYLEAARYRVLKQEPRVLETTYKSCTQGLPTRKIWVR
jgi:hypothetical protein